jgi:hypothetical protein
MPSNNAIRADKSTTLAGVAGTRRTPGTSYPKHAISACPACPAASLTMISWTVHSEWVSPLLAWARWGYVWSKEGMGLALELGGATVDEREGEDVCIFFDNI